MINFKKANLQLYKHTLAIALVAGALPSYAAVESDLLCAYPPSTVSSWGGEVNVQVSMANVIAGNNFLNDQSGTGEHLRIVGYIMSSRDSSGEDNGYVLGLLAGDSSYSDVRNYAASVGADQVTYAPYNGQNSAGVAYQPGTYSCIGSSWWWLVYFAHEAGGHNYNLDHGDGHINPKTIMLHNYCGGGGATWPYLYSNPNVWYGGVNMLGDGAANCTGSSVNGGDSAYGISSHCQSMCDTTLRVVYAPVLNNTIYHWAFTNASGSAPAGTINYDLVSGAPAVVRGNGAIYTGNALRLPGGTTGNVAMSSMAAYIDLPNGILSSQTNITIEIWAAPQSAKNWARIMDFGNSSAGELAGNPTDPAPGTTSQTDGIMLTADIGTDLTQQRFEAPHNGTTYTVNSALATTAGVLHHYAITFTDGAGIYGTNGGRWQWYRDGDSAGFLDMSNHLAAIQDVNEWLGRSEWSGDSLANNDYSEVRVSNVALTRGQVSANYFLGPNYVPRSTTMVASDQWSGSTRSFNSAGNWSDGLPPSAGKTYDMSDFNLITPNTTAAYTFAGSSLHASGGIFFSGASGSSTITVTNFQIDNEEICNGNTAGGSTFTLAGNLYVTNNNIVRGSLGPVNINANLIGNGSITLYANTATLTGNNTNFTGKIRIGNGIIGALNLSSEAQLGANPPSFTPDQLILNRGWLYTTTSFAISNPNRGITIGVNDGLFDVASGTTLTLGCPLSSGYQITSGNALTTQTEASGIVAGVLVKLNSGTLVLSNANPDFNGAIQISSGTLSIAGAGQLGDGNFGNPITDNGVFDYSSSASQTISSTISGTGSITKNGFGTLSLSGANTLSGSVTINNGTLYANATNAVTNRAFSYVSGITVNSGGTLRSGQNGLFGWDGTQDRPISVNAGGTLTCDSGADVGVGTVTLNGGTLANLGASAIWGSWRFDNAGDVLAVTDNSTASAVNVKFANGGAINVSAGKTLNFTGTITDASSGGISSVAIGGQGTVLLSGVNTYTGATLINGGRLTLTDSGSLSSSNIATASGAIFDVSGLSSPFTIKAGQMLGGSDTNLGPVTTVSGAKVSAGTDGGFGTNFFTTNVTMVSGAYLCFDLGASASGPNDRIVFGGDLNLNNTAVRIKGPVNLDPTQDYLLATVLGALSGTVNPAPIWDVQPGNYGAFSVVVTNGNQLMLHAISLPPSFVSASVSPTVLGRNQTLFISAAAVPGTYPVSNYTANAASIGGPSAVTLIADGAGNFTNSAVVNPSLTPGSGLLIGVTVTDSNNISFTTNFAVSVVVTNRTWNGGSGSDNNWGSNPNWSAGAAPGFAGDSVTFGGSTRLTPLMETNYSVAGLTFNSGSGSFTLGASASRYLTLTGAGITNNSTVSQSVNIPLSLNAAQTLNAASGNLTFSQNITNNGNLLTVAGNSNTTVSAAITGSAGLTKTGTGTLTLTGVNTYSNITTVSGGMLTVSGVVGGGDKTIASVSGKAAVNVSGMFTNGNVVVGAVSGAVGAIYQTGGNYSSAGGITYLGHLPGAFGYARVDGGTFSVPNNDLQIGTWGSSGGTGGNALFEVGGGTVADAGWLILARGTSSQTNVLNQFGGLTSYAGGGFVNCWGVNQVGIVNVIGGVISNSTAVGINLNQSGNANNTGVLNLNGGTVQANSISGANARLNFNGGTLKASAANTAFVSSIGAATVYGGGATINNNGYAVTVNTPLLAPTGNGVNGIASFTSGAGYIAPPIITVNRGAGDTTGVGATAIAQIDRSAGTVTNIIITCPGVNYTVTPTFALSGGGATTPATIAGQPPTANTSGGLTTTGTGTLTLSSGNSYTGSTIINGGTLRFSPPVLRMSFDNVSGTTVINQGSGGAAMNGTLTGTATIVGGGRFGNALSIPGGDSSAAYVLFPSSVVSFNSAGNWSVGLWVKTSTAGGAYLNQGDGGWSSGNTTFYLNNGSGAGTKAGGVRYGQGWEQGTATINNGRWHYIVLTASGGVKRQYVDGALDALVTDAWSGNGTGGQLRIGGTGTGQGDGQVGLNGLIDEVCAYDRALTPAEVQQLYSANSSQPLAATTPVTVAAGANLDLSGYSPTIASLSGAGKVTNSASFAATLTLSNNTGTTMLSGSIADQAASNAVSLVQAGNATNIFTGANSYRGTTTIRGGTFLVNGSLGTNAVSVTNGGTLGGNGTINGTVTVQNNGLLSPGSGIGKLSVSSAALQSGGTTLMEISKSPQTNDQLRVIGTLVYGGTLIVTNVSGTLAANDSFQLFSAGSAGGSFSATNLPPLNLGLGWSFNSTSGLLTVIQTVATNATSMTYSVGGGAINLSWPSDHTGWRLQVQTNHLSTGLGTNWFDVPGSSDTNSLSLPIDLNNESIFYRLMYQ
jgi:fibronectin-binding autotransporter adhesin